MRGGIQNRWPKTVDPQRVDPQREKEEREGRERRKREKEEGQVTLKGSGVPSLVLASYFCKL